MAVKLTIYNTKGGAGKTTTAKSLAGELARRNYKVLLVDCDSSANTTKGIAHKQQPAIEFSEIISEHCDPAYMIDEDDEIASEIAREKMLDAICTTVFPNLYLVPASTQKMHKAVKDMSLADFYTGDLLQYYLQEVEDDYDFVIYDTKEGEGLWLTNVLTFTDYIICPTEPTADSVDGFVAVRNRIGTIKKNNKNIKFLGLFLTKYTHDKKDQSILLMSKEVAAKHFIPVAIRYSKILESARNNMMPVCYFDEKSNPATDYAVLTDFLLENTYDWRDISPNELVGYSADKLITYTDTLYFDENEKLKTLKKEYKDAFTEYKSALKRSGNVKPEPEKSEWLTVHDDTYSALLDDIKENGIKEPILARKDGMLQRSLVLKYHLSSSGSVRKTKNYQS